MNYILFDGEDHRELLPLTYTRPVAHIRVGILPIYEKWERVLGEVVSFRTQDYLSKKFKLKVADGVNVEIRGGVLPNNILVQAILSLQPQQALYDYTGVLLAFSYKGTAQIDVASFNRVTISQPVQRVAKVWDIFKENEEAIASDYSMLISKRTSTKLDATNTLIGDQLFVEEGAKVSCAIINTETGPVYIGKDTTIMEGSIVRGPFALCDGAVLKMGAKIYGATTIGPYSKVGGEVNNSVIQGYSNKGHDGFLGNSVLGEWCNLGADTNTSNLKNNYGPVKVWNYGSNSFANSRLQFCGLIMGDHSKSGINTMFNTGTVIGVNANVYGADFPAKFIPSFSWGGANALSTYKLEKAFEVATRVCERRNVVFNEDDEAIMRHIFQLSAPFRGD